MFAPCETLVLAFLTPKSFFLAGALLGQRDLKFLRNMYAIFFFAVPACMLRLKSRARLGVQVVGIGTIWSLFSTYNLIRTSTWHLRLAQLQMRTEARAAADEIV